MGVSGIAPTVYRPGTFAYSRPHVYRSVGPFPALASWLYMEDVFSIVRGVPRIEGVPTRENAIAGFERIYGRPMVEFEYFEAVAALKHAVIFLRSYGNDKETGAVESVHLDFATGHLQRYLDQNP